MSYNNTTRAALGVLALTLAAIIVAGTGSALVATEDVHIDAAANQSVEVDVDFVGAPSNISTYDPEATVRLMDGSTEVTNTTVSATSETTKTATLDPPDDLSAGNYTLELDATNESRVERNTSRMVTTKEVEVENATTDDLQLDVGFRGAETTTADITVESEAGSTIITDSLEYIPSQHTDNQWLRTLYYNESDGLTDGNLTVTTTHSPASGYDAMWVSAGDESGGGGFLAGEIAGQDKGTALAGVGLIGSVLFLLSRRDP